VYQRSDHSFETGGAGGAVAWPAHLTHAETTLVRRPWMPRVDFCVDLGEAIGSPRWCRGAVTLVAMVVALVHVAPGSPPLPAPAQPSAAPRPDAIRLEAVRGAAPGVRVPARFARFARFVPPMPAHPPVVADGAPIRLAGPIGESLYTTLRAAGAAPSVAAAYIRAVAPRVDIGEITPADRYDIVVAHAPGATGPARDGQLLYAGIVHDGQPLSLLHWTIDGHEQWLDAAGMGTPTGGFTVPVADARLSSGFGMRFHPILGFSRMHQGVDLAAPYGTPIVAAAEGIVRFAGAHGGYGNFVQLQHGGGMGTGYGHMSGIVVRVGEAVRQGELIGYVGSTGLSTGPHCHFEVYQNGLAVDPQTANFAVAPQLRGAALGRFRAALAKLVALPLSSPSSRT
jgi:murein DD-endopeptidase MepM/ murein hydrolase activator NlpD